MQVLLHRIPWQLVELNFSRQKDGNTRDFFRYRNYSRDARHMKTSDNLYFDSAEVGSRSYKAAN